jgi:hypothetical protein
MTPELSDYDLLLAVRKLPRILVSLMKEYPGRIFVAGGYLRSIITSDPINDIDVFCDTPELARACAGRVADEHKKELIETNNAFTIYTRPHPIQFIHRWTFKEPGECVASFDFTIARAAIWWDEPKEGATFIYGAHWCSTCDERFYPDLAARRLVYCSPVRIEEAGGSLLRVLKFYQRGYNIPMDSLGAVLARITGSVDFSVIDREYKLASEWESHAAKVITGLLSEVDPLIDPDHISHLASHKGSDDGR